MADGPLAPLFWRALDGVDYWLTLARLRIPRHAGRSPPGDAGRSGAEARSRVDRKGISQDRALKSRACQSEPYRWGQSPESHEESPHRQWWRISSAPAHFRKTG
jgi:hypothetical protein